MELAQQLVEQSSGIQRARELALHHAEQVKLQMAHALMAGAPTGNACAGWAAWDSIKIATVFALVFAVFLTLDFH